MSVKLSYSKELFKKNFKKHLKLCKYLSILGGIIFIIAMIEEDMGKMKQY